ncbi:MAG: glycosyltransferase [Anaerolineae bacterium]|nr:glycosyltransferase [Anaerolineae bacterium]
MPRVSVIIPTYNRADMVCEAIDSVMTQTLKDVEVIVVDDGSNDGTGDLLRERYGERIRYFYQENQGRAVARNRGVRASRSPYLLFLDSDDWLLPDALRQQAEFLDAHPDVDVVYSDGYYCDATGQPIQHISLERPPVPEGKLLEVMVLHNVVVATHSALVRRRALDRLGDPYFDETLRGTEDADLWLRLAAVGATFAYQDVLTCKYRLHEGNASSRTSPQWQRRWQSVRRFKFKVFNADFFPDLSLPTRREFIRQLLLVFLKSDIETQEEVLHTAHFEQLPPQYQAALLYYLGVENIVKDRAIVVGRKRLKRAIALNPRLQYRGILALSYLGHFALALVISLRRQLERLRGKTDHSLAPHWRGLA